jgi:glutaredoxin
MTEIKMLEEAEEDQAVEEARLVLNVVKKGTSPTIVQINNSNRYGCDLIRQLFYYKTLNSLILL